MFPENRLSEISAKEEKKSHCCRLHFEFAINLFICIKDMFQIILCNIYLHFVLKLQMELEKQQFQEERAERQRLLLERQAREIEAFDEESARLGFDAMAIAEASQEPLPADDISISGSMLSLAHSNSASSFTHTAL